MQANAPLCDTQKGDDAYVRIGACTCKMEDEPEFFLSIGFSFAHVWCNFYCKRIATGAPATASQLEVFSLRLLRRVPPGARLAVGE